MVSLGNFEAILFKIEGLLGYDNFTFIFVLGIFSFLYL